MATGKIRKCKKCGMQFHFKENYDWHVRRCTEEPEPKIEKKKVLRCYRCGRQFTEEWIHKKHLREKKCTKADKKKHEEIKKEDVEGWT